MTYKFKSYFTRLDEPAAPESIIIDDENVMCKNNSCITKPTPSSHQLFLN
jgi:hypothetical protein